MLRKIMIAVLLVSGAVVHAADWPQFRGPQFKGTSNETEWQAKWKEPPPMWEARVEGGHSSVVIVNGQVYTQGADRMRGDDAKTLAAKYPDMDPSPNGREFLICLDADTGKEKWRTQLAVNRYSGRGSLATPAVADGRVFCYGPYGKLTCCDSTSGKILWQRDLMTEIKMIGARDGLACSPTVYDGKVMLHVAIPEQLDPKKDWKQDSLMHTIAFDVETGKEVWRSNGHQSLGQGGHGAGTWGSPVVMILEGKATVVSYLGNAVFGVDPETGEERWVCDFTKLFTEKMGHFYSSFWPIQVSDDSFLCQVWNDHPKNCRLSRAFRLRIKDNQPELVWENGNLAVQLSNYTVWDGYLYAMDTTMLNGTRRKRQKEFGQLQCIDVETGKTVWHTNDFYDPAIGHEFNREDCDNAPTWLVVDGKIIIWDRVQIIIGKVSPNGFERLSAFPLGKKLGKTWTALALAEGRLFVRSGGLYGIDLRTKN